MCFFSIVSIFFYLIELNKRFGLIKVWVLLQVACIHVHIFHVMKKKRKKDREKGFVCDLIKDDVEGLYNLGHTTPLS